MSENETAAKPAKEKAAPKEKRRGVGAIAEEAIRAGKSNQEVLDAVRAELPESKATMASVNWYRNNLRGGGEDVPTAREVTARRKAEAKPAEAPAADAF